MNKEELKTLLTPQGTSHCSCLEHCFLFQVNRRAPLAAHWLTSTARTKHPRDVKTSHRSELHVAIPT